MVGIGSAISYEGIYLDSATNTLLDVGGDNTNVEDGTIYLTNTARIRGRAQGRLEWAQVETTSGGLPTMTAKVRYYSTNGTEDWGPIVWNTSASNTTTITQDFEWMTDGGMRLVKVFRGAYDPQSGWIKPDMPTIHDRLRKIMQQRAAPAFIKDLKSLDRAPDIREIRARETLRRVIGEENYRYFLRKGFITVMNPKSGNTFQIFPGHGITNVYFRGKMTERLCVVMRGDFPPTDSLIMRYLMILNNEEQFRSLANKHEVFQTQRNRYHAMLREPDRRSLPEIFAALQGKKVA